MINRIDNLDSISKSKNIDAYLLTSAATVRYLSGYFYNFEIGPSPFQLIPAAVFGIPGCYRGLIVADNESEQLHGLDPKIKVIPYTSYVFDKPLDFTNVFRQKLLEVIRENGLKVGKLGVEANSLPYSICEALGANFPDIELVDVSAELSAMRMVKDAHEIALIRAAVHLCDVGQEAVVKYAEPGMSELDLFKMVRGDMENVAGKRLPMMTDLVSGKRTFEGGGNPSSKKIEKGDLILSDLTPCLNGYWGDTCSTIAVGQPTQKQQDHFSLVKEALKLGISAIKPGVQAKTIDNLLRMHLSPVGQYGHHSGHGVGLAYHEEPRIVPYNDIVLAPNMVIALEPGIYIDDYGIRLEHLVAVTETGCEVLSKFNHRLEI
jgi:Xaa-Pro aminopeptidase